MNMNTDNWLACAGKTLDSAPNAPRHLYERLKYVANLLKDCGKLPSEAVLLYRAGEDEAEFRTIEDQFIVGRGKPADLILGEKRLSRRHFMVTHSQGIGMIQDLESRNGTYVNGKRIEKRELRDGDIVEAGGLVFVFLDSS